MVEKEDLGTEDELEMMYKLKLGESAAEYREELEEEE
jgi:hypothetical protein